MLRLCVFCGSSSGQQPVFSDHAGQFGELLVERGIGLVYGGGNIGLMGILADAVLHGGGEVIGVIPRGLMDRELAHPGLTTLHVVDSMHQRKALMADTADAFAALPGGFGTADELFEVLTWSQLGFHCKPIGLLNTAGYFDGLIAWLDHVVAEKFVSPSNRRLLLQSDCPEDLLNRLFPEINCDGNR